jgi:ferritin-like metal-binding protein YciE
MEVKNLEGLYVDGLRDLYSAEKQLVATLPKVANAASTPELKEAVENHLDVTKNHVDRLEKIFDDLGESPSGHKCVAMEGLLKEGAEFMETVEKGPVLDAALIGAAQKVEHYEISGYGTSRTFAQLLGHKEHAEILQNTLDEEGATDKELTKLAEELVNERAAEQSGKQAAGSGSRK